MPEEGVVCSCTRLDNFYYAVITDRGKVEFKPKVYQNTTHSVLLLITIPLIIMGVVGPCVMVALDHNDYAKVEDNVYKVTGRVAKILQKVRNKLNVQEIYYKEKEIERF